MPDIAAELDATADNFLLRCLGFAARGIGDKRAVPALVRALPKTCVAENGGYGLRCKDPGVLALLQKHAGHTSAGDTFGFGSPLSEVAAALRKLTGASHGEDELGFVHLAGTPRQQALQRALFQRSAERWAAWWEAAGGGPVGLDSVAQPAAELAGFPRGSRVTEALHVRGGTLEPAGGGGTEVFFDLDTGRQAGLPARLRPDQADEIAGWAAAEGFDLMGVEVTTGGKPCYAVRGLGLTAWPLDPARRADVLADLKADKPPAVGPPAGGLLAPFDAAAGRHRPADPGLFLFRTREGGHGWLYVGAEVRQVLPPSDKPRAASVDPAADPVGIRKGRRFDYALVVDKAKP